MYHAPLITVNKQIEIIWLDSVVQFSNRDILDLEVTKWSVCLHAYDGGMIVEVVKYNKIALIFSGEGTKDEFLTKDEAVEHVKKELDVPQEKAEGIVKDIEADEEGKVAKKDVDERCTTVKETYVNFAPHFFL